MNISTNIFDYATKYLKQQSKAASVATSKAIRAAGFELRKVLKAGMIKEAPGGERWPVTSAWTKYRLLEKRQKQYAGKVRKLNQAKNVRPIKVKRLSLRGETTALRRLANASLTKWFLDYGDKGEIKKTKAHTGFIKPSSIKYSLMHTEGITYPVTPKMRRMIFAAGLILKASNIKVPKRPMTEPVLKKNQAKIQPFVDKRLAVALKGGNPKTIEADFS